MPIRKLITKFRRRPFPANLTALRACRISYAQFGEDLFLTYLLGYERTEGTYLDIGCYHPIQYSNTYIFYQRGWSGVTIDPNPAFAAEWKRYRARDQFLNVAISEESGTTPYISNAIHPAMNRICADPNEVLGEHERMIEVPSRPISSILQSELKGRTIDLMSVDCEGYDIEILRQMDFHTWKPSVIAAEDPGESENSEVVRYLREVGYACRARIGLTRIFQRT